MRKIIQLLEYDEGLFALADDGSVWRLRFETKTHKPVWKRCFDYENLPQEQEDSHP